MRLPLVQKLHGFALFAKPCYVGLTHELEKSRK
jgi:hypothetical protein